MRSRPRRDADDSATARDAGETIGAREKGSRVLDGTSRLSAAKNLSTIIFYFLNFSGFIHRADERGTVTSRRALFGVGPLSHQRGVRDPLGLIQQHTWIRPEKDFGKKTERKKKAFEEKCGRSDDDRRLLHCPLGNRVFHRILKSGCRIEERKLQTAEGLRKCLALDSLVAWRIQFLTMLGAIGSVGSGPPYPWRSSSNFLLITWRRSCNMSSRPDFAAGFASDLSSISGRAVEMISVRSSSSVSYSPGP